MKIETKYDIDQCVFIPNLNMIGRIQNIYVGRHSIEYNVRYFTSGRPETCYFLEEELSLEDINKLGFKKE